MNYLVTKDNTIVQISTSIEDLFEYLEVNITDKGVVKIGNKGLQLPTTYNMEDFTKEKILKDVKAYYLKTIAIILKIGIFKLERI